MPTERQGFWNTWCPREESNLDLQFRKLPSSPLDYGGNVRYNYHPTRQCLLSQPLPDGGNVPETVLFRSLWWDLNPRPLPYHGSALPLELHRLGHTGGTRTRIKTGLQSAALTISGHGVMVWIRGFEPRLERPKRPVLPLNTISRWYARTDSNRRPKPCKSLTLARLSYSRMVPGAWIEQAISRVSDGRVSYYATQAWTPCTGPSPPTGPGTDG